MSVGATPSLNFIGDTVGDVAPHAMSEMRGIRFASGNSPTTGAISLSDFRNQTLTSTVAQQAKIQALDKQAGDIFGYSVAISDDGNTAIAGAHYEVGLLIGEGAAYIFTRSGANWSPQAKIQASDKQGNDHFGYSVAISSDGNTAIMGAENSSISTSFTGAAYIFTRSGTSWTQQAKIMASDKQQNDKFGYSVSISDDGNTAIVGAFREFVDEGLSTGPGGYGFPYAGSAYIFTRSGTSWTQRAKIQASDKQIDDRFGISVAMSGDGNTAIVGADEGFDVNNGGSAYIFTRSGTSWTQQAKIMASDNQVKDDFGISVAISENGNTAIAGAHYEDTGGTDAGAAYIFTRSGASWTQQAKIQASDKQGGDRFGYSVSISGDGNAAIVGAFKEDTGGTDAGAAYIFTRSGTTWTQKQKIQASDKQGYDYFGQSVSISSDGNTVIAGAAAEDTGGTDAGAAYIFGNSGYYI
jgi:regulation of enolase protein 1 (concanavalin A-like superfamily)